MNYCIIPNPYYLKETEGIFRFKYDTRLVLGKGCTDKELYYAQLLNSTIDEKMGFSLRVTKGGVQKVIFWYADRLREMA